MENESIKDSYWPFIIIVLLILVVQAIFPFVLSSAINGWDNRGAFGDMFGAVGSLYSGLAFAGIIYTIFLQRKELTLQRKELELTRNELKRSADSQSEIAEIQKDTAIINAKGTLLSMHLQIKDSIQHSATPRALGSVNDKITALSRSVDQYVVKYEIASE
jgi:hypothetical protein